MTISDPEMRALQGRFADFEQRLKALEEMVWPLGRYGHLQSNPQLCNHEWTPFYGAWGGLNVPKEMCRKCGSTR